MCSSTQEQRRHRVGIDLGEQTTCDSEIWESEPVVQGRSGKSAIKAPGGIIPGEGLVEQTETFKHTNDRTAHREHPLGCPRRFASSRVVICFVPYFHSQGRVLHKGWNSRLLHHTPLRLFPTLPRSSHAPVTLPPLSTCLLPTSVNCGVCNLNYGLHGDWAFSVYFPLPMIFLHQESVPHHSLGRC